MKISMRTFSDRSNELLLAFWECLHSLQRLASVNAFLPEPLDLDFFFSGFITLPSTLSPEMGMVSKAGIESFILRNNLFRREAGNRDLAAPAAGLPVLGLV